MGCFTSLMLLDSSYGSNTGSGRGGLDHESPVKFLYIHESRNLLETFHKSRDWIMN